MKKLLFVIGTRPEAIKLYPVIKACRKRGKFSVQICATNQHTDLVQPFFLDFGLQIDFFLDLDSSPQSLHQKVALQICQFEKVLKQVLPDLVVVQGDTTSAFVGALAAHYSRIPVAHIEAGLRTEDLFSPWPEESHRRLIDQLSSFYFVPTQEAKRALLKEGMDQEAIWMVGNTAIDALLLLKKKLSLLAPSSKKSILVTIHRRENQGKPLRNICEALIVLANRFPEVKICVLLHPNPAVCEVIQKLLGDIENIVLRPPLDHLSFIELMMCSTFILTDSGGIQEEAPYLGKPVLILRETTERPEGIEGGSARLIGTSKEQIISNCEELLTCEESLSAMSQTHMPYGKGDSGAKIVEILEEVMI